MPPVYRGWNRLFALIFQYENGTAAILACGTTGENAALSPIEYKELIRLTVRECAGKIKVIVGIGHNNTKTALINAEDAKFSGADGVLMVTTYYNKSTQKGLFEHFMYVADRVEPPMLVCNIPSCTGIGISLDTYRVLSQHPNIVGVKEAHGDRQRHYAPVSDRNNESKSAKAPPCNARLRHNIMLSWLRASFP